MNKLKSIFPETMSFLTFYIFYGFCVGCLVYLALTSETVGLGRSESIRYSIYTALVVAPIVYLGVQIVEHKEQKTKELREKLRLEIKKYLDTK